MCQHCGWGPVHYWEQKHLVRVGRRSSAQIGWARLTRFWNEIGTVSKTLTADECQGGSFLALDWNHLLCSYLLSQIPPLSVEVMSSRQSSLKIMNHFDRLFGHCVHLTQSRYKSSTTCSHHHVPLKPKHQLTISSSVCLWIQPQLWETILHHPLRGLTK